MKTYIIMLSVAILIVLTGLVVVNKARYAQDQIIGAAMGYTSAVLRCMEEDGLTVTPEHKRGYMLAMRDAAVMRSNTTDITVDDYLELFNAVDKSTLMPKRVDDE